MLLGRQSLVPLFQTSFQSDGPGSETIEFFFGPRHPVGQSVVAASESLVVFFELLHFLSGGVEVGLSKLNVSPEVGDNGRVLEELQPIDHSAGSQVGSVGQTSGRLERGSFVVVFDDSGFCLASDRTCQVESPGLSAGLSKSSVQTCDRARGFGWWWWWRCCWCC